MQRTIIHTYILNYIIIKIASTMMHVCIHTVMYIEWAASKTTVVGRKIYRTV